MAPNQVRSENKLKEPTRSRDSTDDDGILCGAISWLNEELSVYSLSQVLNPGGGSMVGIRRASKWDGRLSLNATKFCIICLV